MGTLKQRIFASKGRPTVVRVETPEWPEAPFVFVRQMSVRQRDRLEASMWVGEGENRRLNEDNFRARLIALTLCDENGERAFSDDPADVEELGDMGAVVMNRVYLAADKLNKLTQEEREAVGKSSGQAPNSDSDSASP